jgi:ribosomal protein L29
MEIAKARSLSEQELEDELVSARRHLYDLRFQLATRQLTDYSQISQTRKDIARLLTVQTERKLADGAAAATGAAAGGEEMSAATAPERGKRKAKVGRVVSDKMDTTIVVSVERRARHRIYQRVIRLTTKFTAHDGHN